MQRKENKKREDFSSGNLSKYSVGIVVSDFNADITGKLLERSWIFDTAWS